VAVALRVVGIDQELLQPLDLRVKRAGRLRFTSVARVMKTVRLWPARFASLRNLIISALI
jgi:hypothetical protein